MQDILSRTALETFLAHIRREWIHAGSLWSNHAELWAENGDALSRIYAGTGALNTSFTRSGKRTLGGLLSDATKSVSRAYINNFQDKGKGKETLNPIAAIAGSSLGTRLPMGAGARFDINADQITGVSRLVDMSVACRYLAAQCLVRQGKWGDATEMLGEHNPFKGTGEL